MEQENILQNKSRSKIDKLILNEKNYGKGYSLRKELKFLTVILF